MRHERRDEEKTDPLVEGDTCSLRNVDQNERYEKNNVRPQFYLSGAYLSFLRIH